MRHLIILILAAAMIALSPAPAQADLGDQLGKILAEDGAAGDEFGLSIAISGTTAIVGAYRDDDNGDDSGSAYLLDISDPANPVQLFKLLPDDGTADDWFGFSVAISGTTAVVGAHAGNFAGSCSAYIFDTTTGRQLFKLLSDEGEQCAFFGIWVAISGTTAIVGDSGVEGGRAYLFDTTTGRQIAKLQPDGEVGETFGFVVAINGNIAIVGDQRDDDNGTSSGSAYLFDISDPANPTQLAKLLPDDGAAGDRFGLGIAISGAIAIVGARNDDDNGTESGSVYFFDISDPANPKQLMKLMPIDGAAGDQFGTSVAISGATAIVGARWDDDNGSDSGSAYLFDAGAPGMCPWDLDGSGDVGVKDLLFLLGAWGPCPPKGDCLADFDDSGDVGVKDLLFLLGAWGLCP